VIKGKTARRTFGDAAESFVASHLQQHGFAICEQNYQKMYGEIDIIARKKDIITFVEVKVRRACVEHMPAIVTPTKQKKIARVAREYMARNGLHTAICRFDVALVSGDEGAFKISYIENAFVG